MVRSDTEDVDQAVNRLVDDYRVRALWFLRPDYYPETDAERRQVLDYIEQRADLATFKEVAALRKCLSRKSSATSAA